MNTEPVATTATNAPMFPENYSAFKHDLKTKVIDVCRVLDVTPEEIDDAALLINGPGPLFLDSMDSVEIAMMVHRSYGVKVQDLSTAKAAMKSIESLANHVWTKSGRSL